MDYALTIGLGIFPVEQDNNRLSFYPMIRPVVFVYADGTFRLRDWPGPLYPVLRIHRPVERKIKWDEQEFDPFERITVHVDEYQQYGAMFDGRPIYCAENYRVEMCSVTSITAVRAEWIVDQHMRDDLNDLRQECNGVELDYWVGDVPSDEERLEYASQLLTKRGAKMLVLIKKENN